MKQVHTFEKYVHLLELAWDIHVANKSGNRLIYFGVEEIEYGRKYLH